MAHEEAAVLRGEDRYVESGLIARAKGLCMNLLFIASSVSVLLISIAAIRLRQKLRSRPDPFAVMQTPVKRYAGYDYDRAVAAKWESLPPGSAARRAIEAGQHKPESRVVRLVKKR